jgi:hypothetical protein
MRCSACVLQCSHQNSVLTRAGVLFELWCLGDAAQPSRRGAGVDRKSLCMQQMHLCIYHMLPLLLHLLVVWQAAQQLIDMTLRSEL